MSGRFPRRIDERMCLRNVRRRRQPACMISVDELLARKPEMRPTDFEVAQGFLIVTGALVVLCTNESDRRTGIIVSVPVARLIEQWSKTIPPQGGSRVCYAGYATVRAKFGSSGIAALPLIAIGVEEITFKHDSGLAARYVP